MRKLQSTLAGLCCVIFVSVSPPAHTASDNVDILRVRQPSAGAEAYFGDCTDVISPPPGTVCHETRVLLFRETVVYGGGSNAPSEAPWAVYVARYTLTFGETGLEPVVTDYVDGFLLDPRLAYSDKQHLLTAALAARVPLSDGSDFNFQGTWTATGDRMLYGNNGPENSYEGLPRHFNDKCITFNANAHQTVRNATMAGTVNGSPVYSYAALPDAADIFYNHFIYISVAHGGCN